MTKDFRILGIDPGTATTGYGIIDLPSQNTYRYVGSGIIQTSKLLSSAARLKIIREDIVSLIELYSPDAMAIESIFFFKNAKTLVPVAQARGVVLEAAESAGIGIAEYTPMQVKMSVSGYGKAEKKEIQFVVARLLNHAQIIKPDDACDAVAIAICHARNMLGFEAARPKQAQA
ncbi:MAG: crossover junction endodeoxyribonuclease RuvC [Candidatus Obscuribacterales bacterium]|nr:crossover junction endodeoxyribonuclease RuvC [Candidatus Obscuribacterales bacterium]